MTYRDDLLRRVMAANPLPIEVDLPEEVVDARPPLALLIKEDRSLTADSQHRVPSTGPSGKVRRWSPKPAAVFATVFVLVLAVIGIVAILTSGQPEFVEESSPTTTTAETTTTVIPPPGSWNPILATTRAKPSPPAATCPSGSNPTAPGPSGPDRPRAGYNWNLKGVFDQHAGRIVYLDTAGETWTFDVCTNTWQNMNPEVGPVPPEDLFDAAGEPSGAIIALVYDADSDVTVAFGYERVSVYDANTNTWTKTENETYGFEAGLGVAHGVAYDPVTGLIMVTTVSNVDRLWAYDVDTNTWTLIGRLGGRQDQDYRTGDLLGYSQSLDRLIFASHNEATVLLDPRSGEVSPIFTETPYVDLVWPSGVYGPAADTVYVKKGGEAICGFDTSTRTWSDCFETPAELRNRRYTVFAAMVGDQINQRLILINGVGRDWGSEATDDVWAVDLKTGNWTELLASTVDATPTADTATTSVVTTTPVFPPSEGWNPILATTRAKPAPPAATCPPGSNPDTPGSNDQLRPQPGPGSNQAAAFDRHTGRIIFVDEATQTWTFDVCANTWQKMNQRVPTSEGLFGELVYDIDSDLTISFGWGAIAVYDAQTNTWTQRDLPSDYKDSGWVGAVYDPVSGLAVAQTEEELVAYDVDTDRWTSIGPIVDEGFPPFLIGYAPETDRLIFLDFDGAIRHGRGRLVDPRSGEYTSLEHPPFRVAGGFGSFSYATGGETAYTFGHDGFGRDGFCKLDPVTMTWACTGNAGIDQFPSAMVFDPSNDRLVLINDTCCDWSGLENTNDVWAVDLDTGEWTQLLAPSDQ